MAIQTYDDFAGTAGADPDSGLWDWTSQTATWEPELSGSGSVVLPGDDGTTSASVLRSTEIFYGEVQGTILNQPEAAADRIVTIGWAVQDTNDLTTSTTESHNPFDGYYILIQASGNTISLWRRISNVSLEIGLNSPWSLDDFGATIPLDGAEQWHWAAIANGVDVNCWVWVDGDTRPDRPTITAADDTFTTGKLRFAHRQLSTSSGSSYFELGPITYGDTNPVTSLGTDDVFRADLGTTQVRKMSIGDDLVWTSKLPLAPSAPTNVVATAGDGGIDLSWDPPLDDGGGYIFGYQVDRNIDSAGWTTIADVHTDLDWDETALSDGGLTNGVPVVYRVSCENAIGFSPTQESNEATPSAPAPEFTDDFDRSDGAIGADWVTGDAIYQFGGSMEVVSNAAHEENNNRNFAMVATESAFDDMYAAIDVTLTGSGTRQGGPVVRGGNRPDDVGDPAYGSYHFAWSSDSGGTYHLRSWDSGSENFLDSTTGVGTSGTRRLRIEVIGTTINCYADGSLVLGPITDTDWAGASTGDRFYGFGGYSSSAGNGVTYDDFEAGEAT